VAGDLQDGKDTRKSDFSIMIILRYSIQNPGSPEVVYSDIFIGGIIISMHSQASTQTVFWPFLKHKK
jgi:hypothetical protein